MEKNKTATAPSFHYDAVQLPFSRPPKGSAADQKPARKRPAPHPETLHQLVVHRSQLAAHRLLAVGWTGR